MTNHNISKQKEVNNTKLLKILERIELDRPILMKDKLDIIWGDEPTPFDDPIEPKLGQGESTISSMVDISFAKNDEKPEKRIVNEHGVKRELERLKAKRA